MDTTIRFTVNGQTRTVVTDPQRSLLEVLREDLHLTGTKYGCGEGQCRACTVLLEGRSTTSCLTKIGTVAGKRVQTVEGLAKNGVLHPVQEAFLAHGAFQCGYCTPGMILDMVGLLAEKPKPTEAEVKSRLQRHLCRCCNYPTMLQALLRAAETKPANL